jgi:hypothetical protein
VKVRRTGNATWCSTYDLARAPGNGEPWSEGEAALLGTASDVELTERLGRSRSAVRSARRRRRVPPDAAGAWTPEEDALLGTMPDAELAKRLRRPAAAVARRRLKFGRAAQLNSRLWTAEEDEIARTLPPFEAAARLGRSVCAV